MAIFSVCAGDAVLVPAGAPRDTPPATPTYHRFVLDSGCGSAGEHHAAVCQQSSPYLLAAVHCHCLFGKAVLKIGTW